jgi:hypothetical protein
VNLDVRKLTFSLTAFLNQGFGLGNLAIGYKTEHFIVPILAMNLSAFIANKWLINAQKTFF